jgi:hypothetical protein
MAHGVRPDDEPLRGEQGDLGPANPGLLAGSVGGPGADGPAAGVRGTRKFQDDPHWRDYLLFYEYFHGDNGAGLGASHQTGWTGVVATLINLFGFLAPGRMLEVGTTAAFRAAAEVARMGGSAA